MAIETKNSTSRCIILILSSIYSPKEFNIDHEHQNTSLQYIDPDFNELSYTLNIFLPIVVGLFVALILGWMLIRYKMSSHQRSNYNGSIYCCPQKCFDFCAKFFECKKTCPKFFKFKKTTKPHVNYGLANKLILFNESNAIPKVRTEQAHRTSIDHMSNASITTSGLKYNLNNGSNSTSSSLRSQNNTLNPNQQHLPFRFLTRDSFSSRRDSFVQMPDLIKSNNFSMNLFHSFQSKNTSLFS